MDAFVTLIGRASVQGAIAILVVWAVCRLFPRLPASLRCGLWWLACLKLVVGLVWATPVPLPVLPPAERPAMTILTTVPLAESGTIAAPRQTPTGGAAQFPWALVLLGLWGAGLAGHLAWTAAQLRRVRAVIREAEPVEERWVVNLFAELRDELRVSPRAEVLAAEVETPQVLGLFRPRVLLPRRALSRLSPAELAMTLCHELLHVRRGDLWLGWVPALAQRLFFFHPLARLAVREYALAREAACDAEVLRVLDPAPDAYGRLLLRLGVAPRVPRLAAAGAAPSFETLKRRLMMLQQASDKKRIHPAWWGLVVVVALVGLIPFQMVAQEPGEPAPVAAVEPVPAVEPGEPVPEVAPVPSVEPAPEGVPAPVALPAVASTPGVPTIMPGVPAVAGVPAVPGTPAPLAKVAAVHASPPAPPVPPVPPAAPRPYRASWRSAGGDAYVVQLGRDRHIMSGSNSDLKKADKVLGDSGVWFERNGKEYVIRDAATVRQVEELFKPQMELGKRQAELGKQQAGFGAKQAEFGAQQAEIGAKMAGLGAKQASLAAEQSSRGEEAGEEIEAKMEEVSRQMDALGRQMEKLSEPMEALGGEMEKLGGEMEKLGEQQEKLAEQAEKQVRALFDKAIASGLAQEVK